MRLRRIVIVCPVLVLALVAGAAPAHAQNTGTLAGHVRDAKTGDPLTFCNVVVVKMGGTMTDMRGDFLLHGLPVGSYHIVISRIGHRSFETDVTLSAGDTTRVDAALVPAPVHVDPVVVTATRVEQTVRMAPASVAVVDQTDIDNRQPATFDQAIDAVGGLNVYRSTGISVQSMQIRGSSDVAGGGVGNRVLLLVDGRPALTSDSGGAFWSLVPTQFVDHVEIVKGAFSSLYGSTAMGGVVNVITRKPGKETVARLDMKLGFFEQPSPQYRYTNSTPLQSEVTADLSGPLGHSKRDLRYLLSASRKSSDGFSENTAYTFYDLYGKLMFNINAQRTLELTLGGGHANNDYPHVWLDANHPLQVRDSYRDDRQQKDYASADLHYTALNGDHTRLSTRMYYYHHEQNTQFNQTESISGIPEGLTTQILGDKVGFITQVDRRLAGWNRLVAGVDVQVDYVQSSPDTILYGDHQINNYAVFAQDDINLSKTVTTTLGVRYDWNHLVGGETLEQLSPKVALVWSPTKTFALRTLFAQAFRAPTIAERFLQRELGGDILFIPNPNLGAEHIVDSEEIGVHWTPHPMLGLDVAGFNYHYEDMIYWVDISKELGVSESVYQVRNLNSADMAGVETTVTSTFDALSLSANYTFLDARDQSPGRTDDILAYRPRHTANFGADLGLGRWQLHGDARYRSKIEEVFLFEKSLPAAYWVFNANAQYHINRTMTASVKVNNIFDRAYEELARYRMPGRNWMFGLSFRF
ncbi:MAG TPA: TonB-dependent receptor [Candidatus Krumholzibacteria bacterium]|nr:TonB-dependent receptor [Candidatus Krumholzibacteria bacterium]